MRFKNFLEASNDIPAESYIHSFNEKDPLKTLNEQGLAAKRAIANGTVFYRGFKKPLPYPACRIEPALQRVSKDTRNLYQIMMDASPSLKQFPSRSRSIICSTSSVDASLYGYVHVILPLDDVNIAISQDRDFISQQIGFGGVDIEYLDSELSAMLDAFGIKPDENKKFTDIKRIDRELSKLDFSLRTKESKELWEKIPMYAYSSGMKEILNLFRSMPSDSKMSSLAAEIMTPSALGLSLFNFGGKLTTENEVWFDADALAFHPAEFFNLLDKMKKQGLSVNAQLYEKFKEWVTP